MRHRSIIAAWVAALLATSGCAVHTTSSRGARAGSGRSDSPGHALQPMPATVGRKAQVQFYSDSPKDWDVVSGQTYLCTTPCTAYVDPTRPLLLRASDDTVYLSRISDSVAPHCVLAQRSSTGLLATGITFTALGGAGVITGGTLALVGCNERPGMCTGGLITFGASAVVLGGAILMMLASGPSADIVRIANVSLGVSSNGALAATF